MCEGLLQAELAGHLEMVEIWRAFFKANLTKQNKKLLTTLFSKTLM